MSQRAGKSIIHEQNVFLCLLSLCQIKYYGWKFRVEAHFGKQGSNYPEFAFIIKRLLSLWVDYQFLTC
jgi:hypothetical protein